MNALIADKNRYGGTAKAMPKFQYYFRKAQEMKNPILSALYRKLFYASCKRFFVEMSPKTTVGPGLYIGHPFGITINPGSVIGSNVNIHKGVTIGQENRGSRKGTPTIGNDVWIGVNATVVGNIKIGNDVLIAPNSYVNHDIPDHSIAIGCPAKIIHHEKATENYISNRIETDERAIQR